jgi:hypothetical protein
MSSKYRSQDRDYGAAVRASSRQRERSKSAPTKYTRTADQTGGVKAKSPQLRQTHMGVGYVGVDWPKIEKGDQVLYRLHLAEQRRIDILRDLAIESMKREARNRWKHEQSLREKFTKRREQDDWVQMRRILIVKELEVKQLQSKLKDTRSAVNLHGQQSNQAPTSQGSAVPSAPRTLMKKRAMKMAENDVGKTMLDVERFLNEVNVSTSAKRRKKARQVHLSPKTVSNLSKSIAELITDGRRIGPSVSKLIESKVRENKYRAASKTTEADAYRRHLPFKKNYPKGSIVNEGNAGEGNGGASAKSAYDKQVMDVTQSTSVDGLDYYKLLGFDLDTTDQVAKGYPHDEEAEVSHGSSGSSKQSQSRIVSESMEHQSQRINQCEAATTRTFHHDVKYFDDIYEPGDRNVSVPLQVQNPVLTSASHSNFPFDMYTDAHRRPRQVVKPLTGRDGHREPELLSRDLHDRESSHSAQKYDLLQTMKLSAKSQRQSLMPRGDQQRRERAAVRGHVPGAAIHVDHDSSLYKHTEFESAAATDIICQYIRSAARDSGLVEKKGRRQENTVENWRAGTPEKNDSYAAESTIEKNIKRSISPGKRQDERLNSLVDTEGSSLPFTAGTTPNYAVTLTLQGANRHGPLLHHPQQPQGMEQLSPQPLRPLDNTIRTEMDKKGGEIISPEDVNKHSKISSEDDDDPLLSSSPTNVYLNNDDQEADIGEAETCGPLVEKQKLQKLLPPTLSESGPISSAYSTVKKFRLNRMQQQAAFSQEVKLRTNGKTAVIHSNFTKDVRTVPAAAIDSAEDTRNSGENASSIDGTHSSSADTIPFAQSSNPQFSPIVADEISHRTSTSNGMWEQTKPSDTTPLSCVDAMLQQSDTNSSPEERSLALPPGLPALAVTSTVKKKVLNAEIASQIEEVGQAIQDLHVSHVLFCLLYLPWSLL